MRIRHEGVEHMLHNQCSTNDICSALLEIFYILNEPSMQAWCVKNTHFSSRSASTSAASCDGAWYTSDGFSFSLKPFRIIGLVHL